MEELIKNTKEYLPVKLKDRLGAMVTLDGTVVSFRVTADNDAGTEIVAWTVCTNNGMVALPLIDTTLGAFVPGIYNLYIRVNVAPEVPILGPFEFAVV